jgi:hypothetical protein
MSLGDAKGRATNGTLVIVNLTDQRRVGSNKSLYSVSHNGGEVHEKEMRFSTHREHNSFRFLPASKFLYWVSIAADDWTGKVSIA